MRCGTRHVECSAGLSSIASTGSSFRHLPFVPRVSGQPTCHAPSGFDQDLTSRWSAARGELRGEDLRTKGSFEVDRPIKDDNGVLREASTSFKFVAGQTETSFDRPRLARRTLGPIVFFRLPDHVRVRISYYFYLRDVRYDIRRSGKHYCIQPGSISSTRDYLASWKVPRDKGCGGAASPDVGGEIIIRQILWGCQLETTMFLPASSASLLTRSTICRVFLQKECLPLGA